MLYFVVSNEISKVRLSVYIPAYLGISCNLVIYFLVLSLPVAVSSVITELLVRDSLFSSLYNSYPSFTSPFRRFHSFLE